MLMLHHQNMEQKIVKNNENLSNNICHLLQKKLWFYDYEFNNPNLYLFNIIQWTSQKMKNGKKNKNFLLFSKSARIDQSSNFEKKEKEQTKSEKSVHWTNCEQKFFVLFPVFHFWTKSFSATISVYTMNRHCP